MNLFQFQFIDKLHYILNETLRITIHLQQERMVEEYMPVHVSLLQYLVID